MIEPQLDHDFVLCPKCNEDNIVANEDDELGIIFGCLDCETVFRILPDVPQQEKKS